MIAAVRFVDYVVPLHEPDCLAAIDRLRPDFFFKSDEDASQDIVRSEVELVRGLGGRVIGLPSLGPGRRSTTNMIEAVRQRFTNPP
jgi:bifunctional ADP-heptose synthase (sugar kinase/adenylyltransferase)